MSVPRQMVRMKHSSGSNPSRSKSSRSWATERTIISPDARLNKEGVFPVRATPQGSHRACSQASRPALLQQGAAARVHCTIEELGVPHPGGGGETESRNPHKPPHFRAAGGSRAPLQFLGEPR
jgi:hypothetical protein